MAIPKVLSEAGLEVTGQINVLESPPPIKGLDPVPPPNILTDDILVFFQSLP